MSPLEGSAAICHFGRIWSIARRTVLMTLSLSWRARSLQDDKSKIRTVSRLHGAIAPFRQVHSLWLSSVSVEDGEGGMRRALNYAPEDPPMTKIAAYETFVVKVPYEE